MLVTARKSQSRRVGTGEGNDETGCGFSVALDGLAAEAFLSGRDFLPGTGLFRGALLIPFQLRHRAF